MSTFNNPLRVDPPKPSSLAPVSLLACPWCGQTPKVTKYPMEGAHPDHDLVLCMTEGCPMWRRSMTRDRWNERKTGQANAPDQRRTEP